jgi:superfamily I DNA/RNA helicase
MAFKLIRNGVGCQMLGRDIGRGLIQLTTKLAKEDSTPIDKFASILTEWLDRESTIALANDKPTRVDKLTDQADCLRATIEGSSPKTVGELRNVLQRVFSRENGQVILSSIHRAKGLEWPLVVHLDPWRIPSKQSLMAALATGDQSQLQQEYNMRYVAETRTKHTLINANTEDFSNG